MQHWRTTGIGVLLILAALTKAGAELAQGHHVDYVTLSGGLTAGWGFIQAADGKAVQK